VGAFRRSARNCGVGSGCVSRELALKMGADAAIDPRMRNPSAEMARITGAGPDVVFECIGAPGTLAEAITYAQRDGRVGVLGASMQDDGFPPGIGMAKQLDVYFSLGIDPGEIETAIAVLASGRISTEAMITHTVSLDEFAACVRGARGTRKPGQGDARVLAPDDARGSSPKAVHYRHCGSFR